MIRVNNLKVENRLLPLTLAFEQGDLVHVVGPNGSGKSTFLAALAGMIPSGGQICIDETDIARMDLTTLALHRAYLAQNERPVFSLDVYQYLALSTPLLLKPQETPVVQTIAYLTSRLDLTEKLHCSIHQLSGGEWQRVRLAGSCLQIWPTLNPYANLLILDEPAAALDIGQEPLLYDLLHEICEMGIAVIMANHDLNRTLRYASRVLLLDQGEMQQWGKADTVLNPTVLEPVFHTQIQLVNMHGRSYLLFD
jgi:vitamin B12 transport system ATP-binding protein